MVHDAPGGLERMWIVLEVAVDTRGARNECGLFRADRKKWDSHVHVHRVYFSIFESTTEEIMTPNSSSLTSYSSARATSTTNDQ